MPGRVAWSTYAGDDIEAVVAMMLNREHPNSTRIAPSQGDGGVDIVDRGTGPDGGDVVYQVKRYTGPLESVHKSKIKNSLETLWGNLAVEGRWSHLNVTSWQLITATTASPESDEWFHETLMADYDVHAVWHGLSHLEQLAAKYDDVIDYYLRDGKETVLAAFAQAMDLSRLGLETGDLTPAKVAQRVRHAVGLLERDPLYLYGLRFGHGEPSGQPVPPPERYMFSEYRVDPAADRWHAVDVSARCAASPGERPITGTGTLTNEPGSDFAEAVRAFHEYGAGFTSPPGTFSGSIDAPGGLGGQIHEGQIRLIPLTDPDDEVELRLEMLDPEGEQLAEVKAVRTQNTSGSVGRRAVMSESAGVFDMVLLFDLASRATNVSIKAHDWTGMPVAAAAPGLAFMANFRGPNSLRTSNWNAAAARGAVQQLPTPADKDNSPENPASDNVAFIAHLNTLLQTIQAETDKTVRWPSDEDINDQYRQWEFAAAILNGQVLLASAGKSVAFQVVLDVGTDLPDEPFAVTVPLGVRVGGETFDLGWMVAEVDEYEQVADPVTVGDEVVYSVMTPDRQVRYRRTDGPVE